MPEINTADFQQGTSSHLSNNDVKKVRRKLLNWYQKNQRDLPWRHTTDPYKIWLSEVMLQQTQVVSAIPYYLRFLETFPDLASLAKADLQQLYKLWEGLGYYARARNFHKAAGMVVSNYGGRIPLDYPSFRALPGVGDYIAAAVLSIVTGAPHAVVDGNVKRVLARLFMSESAVNSAQKLKEFKKLAEIIFSADNAADFNQAIMELGATVCLPKKFVCTKCPINKHCLALKYSRVANFPKREIKPAKPLKHFLVGVIEHENMFLLKQRPQSGLLAGFWQFPALELNGNKANQQYFNEWIHEIFKFDVADTKRAGEVRHTYTHFKEQLQIYTCKLWKNAANLKVLPDYKWVQKSELKKYPISGSNHKVMNLLNL